MGEKNKVLIIDDEIEICNLLRDFLTREGFDVVTASSARDGIEKARTEHPSIILLDIKMPEMYGTEAMGKIREFDKETPIIMITAVLDQKTAEDAMELGASDYIVKPFELYYLKESLIEKLSAIKLPSE